MSMSQSANTVSSRTRAHHARTGGFEMAKVVYPDFPPYKQDVELIWAAIRSRKTGKAPHRPDRRIISNDSRLNGW